MKYLSILGSTGSIGKSTLEVVRHLGQEKAQIVALSAGSNIDLLEKQALEFCPKLLAVYDERKASELQRRIPSIPVLSGLEGICAVAAFEEANLVIAAINGVIGLKPTVAAIEAGKDVGFASKEVLVASGELIISLVKKHGTKLIPIDSELTAIFQCLKEEKRENVKKLLITASGGPFRGLTTEALQSVTVEDALKHPNYSMGSKVTIDSSTLMNKGLEMIEAHFLFGIPSEQIEVIVHPQQIIHSMVEFVDNSLLAQMGDTDMLIPIQYAITYPSREKGTLAPFNFMKNNSLTFDKPDLEKFKALKIAYEAIRLKKSYPCYMNGVNEVLVHRFLNKEIRWKDISDGLETLLSQHNPQEITSLSDVEAITIMAKQRAKEYKAAALCV